MMTWMRQPRRWLSITATMALLGGLWIWLSAVPAAATTGGQIPSPREGFLAPNFELERLQGDPITLQQLRGQVVIVNFWASWCPPCRAEMPALEQTYRAHREQGLEILAVNSTHQDSIGAARTFVQEHGLGFPILLDQTGLVGNLYQTRALPTTFFIDRDGVIRKVIIGGPMSETTLRTTVQSLLGEGS